MGGVLRETPIIQEIVELLEVETGDSKLPTILRLRCVTANGSPLAVRISPTVAGLLGEALRKHPLTRGNT
jgi:hypothetical protein